MKKYVNQIIHGDVLHTVCQLKRNSVDVILTDPPYFLDKLDQNWKPKTIHSKKNLQVVTSLPAGMKFDKKKGKKFYQWYSKVSKELLRVLKPGGFFFSFSSPRLYHYMACAIDDSGFEIRDCFIWLYIKNQPKAMSLHHFVNKMHVSKTKKEQLNKQLQGWKTPQVRSCYEPIAVAQKPTKKTYLQNMTQHKVSLINTNVKQGLQKNMFPSNVMTNQLIHHHLDTVFLVDKPTKKEKGIFNDHKTVKPVSLCRHLIQLTTKKNSVILDPFMGSGTTAVACKELGRKFVGIEMNQKYIQIAKERLKNVKMKR